MTLQELELNQIGEHLEGAQRAADALRARLSDQEAELLGAAEVAELVGWKASSISAALTRGRLPTPYARLACGPIWTRAQIEVWLAGRTAAAAS